MPFAFNSSAYQGFDGRELLLGPLSIECTHDSLLEISGATDIAWGPVQLQNFRIERRGGGERIDFNFHNDDGGDDIVLEITNGHFNQIMDVRKLTLKPFALWLWYQNHRNPEIARLMNEARINGLAYEIDSSFAGTPWPAQFRATLLQDPLVINKPLTLRVSVHAEQGLENAVAGREYYALTEDDEPVGVNSEIVRYEALLAFLRENRRQGLGLNRIRKVVFVNVGPPVVLQPYVQLNNKRQRRLSLGGGKR
jgi:hypothetical protein